MEPAHLIAFNLALLAAMASPGPALLIAIKTTVTSGRAAGVATGAGLGMVAALWTLAALLGLDALFALFPWAYTSVKIVGAAYLLWIALGIWRGAGRPIADAPQARSRAFMTGAAVNLGNPKSVLFAAAVLVVIFPPELSPAQMILVTLNHFAVELTVYAGLAYLLSRDTVRHRYFALKPALDRASALVLGALGLRLLTDR